jgi:hypothetical protein
MPDTGLFTMKEWVDYSDSWNLGLLYKEASDSVLQLREGERDDRTPKMSRQPWIKLSPAWIGNPGSHSRWKARVREDIGQELLRIPKACR